MISTATYYKVGRGEWGFNPRPNVMNSKLFNICIPYFIDWIYLAFWALWNWDAPYIYCIQVADVIIICTCVGLVIAVSTVKTVELWVPRNYLTCHLKCLLKDYTVIQHLNEKKKKNSKERHRNRTTEYKFDFMWSKMVAISNFFAKQ